MGLDVGKGEHHATAVTPAGKKVFDRRLPHTEPKQREAVHQTASPAPRIAECLVDEVLATLDEQTLILPGTDAAALIVPSLAASFTATLDQRQVLAARTEEPLEAHRLSQLLT
ncbi:transposase [Streptomyces sp. NPDC057611]|uniref:IS110 family transposase n=1 Tax=Streptomyces sp. NPDC057611 TaxID=3346182 RepID=UPI0036BD9F3A